MVRIIIDTILVLLCFVLQQTAFPALPLEGIVPNIMLFLTATYGFVSGRREGMWIGFFSGLLIDIFYSNLLGFNALLYMLIGYWNGYYKGGFFPEDIKLPMLFIMMSDIVYSILFFAGSFIFRGRYHVFNYAKSVIMPEFFYTLIFALIMYRPLLFILKVTDERREE